MSDLDLVPFVFIALTFIMIVALCFMDYKKNINEINSITTTTNTNTNTNTNIRTNFFNEPLPKYEEFELSVQK